MARRATKAEMARRLEDVFPLVIHCLRPREIRRVVDQKTDWGQTVSDRTLRRYITLAWEKVKEAAAVDYEREFGALKSRLEREISHGFVHSDAKARLAANKQLLALLDLSSARHRQENDDDQRQLADQAREFIAGRLTELAERRAASPDPGRPERQADPRPAP